MHVTYELSSSYESVLGLVDYTTIQTFHNAGHSPGGVRESLLVSYYTHTLPHNLP